MNKSRQLLIVLMLIISGFYSSIYAQQSLYIKENNGALTQVPLSQVQKITFFGADMILQKTDASTITWATADVQKYYYDLTTKVNEQKISDNNILIYPNPSNGSFKINYQVKEKGNIDISIVSIDGRTIRTLLSENKSQGNYSINYTQNLEIGSYFIKVESNNNLIIRKIIILK